MHLVGYNFGLVRMVGRVNVIIDSQSAPTGTVAPASKYPDLRPGDKVFWRRSGSHLHDHVDVVKV